MNATRTVAVVGAVLTAVMSGSALAGVVDFGYSSDTGGAKALAYAWDGGDAGGFGTAGRLRSAMRYAASESAGTSFAGSGFLGNSVNMFVVDFRGDDTFNDAGITLFVMWGNGDGVDSFAATVSASPVVRLGTDGTYTSGVPEVYALGPGVDVREIGPLTIDIDVEHSETPIGYAISNVDTLPRFRFNQNFTLIDAIVSLGGYSAGSGRVWEGVDDDGRDNIFTDGVVVIVPAPSALALLGMGAIGFGARRRRRA